MAIEATAVPTRSRLWTDQDAKQAYDLLTGDPENGIEPQAAKFGVYPVQYDKYADTDEGRKKARDAAEAKARTQGMALDRIIKENHGRRFGVSVWIDQDGNAVGALVPREPIARKAKEDGGSKTPKRSRR